VVLVNTSGEKIGAKGRPLPGSAPVRLVRYDLTNRRIVTDEHGVAIEAADDEIGLLVARPSADAASERQLRGLFAPGDRWVSTDHLFRRDADGDHWLIGHVSELVVTPSGVAAPTLAEEALGALDAVASVAAYPGGAPGEAQRLLAAVQLRPGRTLSVAEVNLAMQQLDPADRPDVIRIVEEIPLTTWWRPDREALRRTGTPREPNTRGWIRDVAGSYRATGEPVRSAGAH
jgi:putative long chain acyl-CoA synthase